MTRLLGEVVTDAMASELFIPCTELCVDAVKLDLLSCVGCKALAQSVCA